MDYNNFRHYYRVNDLGGLPCLEGWPPCEFEKYNCIF
jgi:hypothetical protein